MRNLLVALDFDWRPFLVNGTHLPFTEYKTARLTKDGCSHWGAAIYKWEGLITEGIQTGKLGVYIGETDNLSARLNMYKTGTQVQGNKWVRDNFLALGNIKLFTLHIGQVQFEVDRKAVSGFDIADLSGKNRRLVIEQLLVLAEAAAIGSNAWLVNRQL